MEFRQARSDDVQIIQQLNMLLFEKEVADYDETLNPSWSVSPEANEYFLKRIKEGSCFVAVEGNEVVGYIAGSIVKAEPFRHDVTLAEAENMFVLPEYRGKGVGTKLFELLIGWCRKNGADRISTVASAGNDRAIALYRRLGFKDYTLTLEKEL